MISRIMRNASGYSELGSEQKRLIILLVSAASACVGLVAFFTLLMTLITFAFSGPGENDREVFTGILTASTTLTALVGASLGAVYAFRSQLLSERDGRRSDEQVFSDRYVAAADLLANEAAATRLAGLHSLSTLADDWQGGRKACIAVICSYLRLPFLTPDLPTRLLKGESEVRRMAWKVISAHLQNPADPTSWHEFEFDFSEGDFDYIELDACNLSDVQMCFRNCTFRGGEVRLRTVRITSGRLDFGGAKFEDAQFLCEQASLNDAFMNFGGATFKNSRFYGPHMKIVGRSALNFTEMHCEDTDFTFDDDGMGFVLGGSRSLSGEIDFSRSIFDRCKIWISRYALTGRLVFDGAKTSDVEIGIPSDIEDPAYLNLDIVPKGPTGIHGSGECLGGIVRLRPLSDVPNTLDVAFDNLDFRGGRLTVAARVKCWKNLGLGIFQGSLEIFGEFPAAAETDVDSLVRSIDPACVSKHP